MRRTVFEDGSFFVGCNYWASHAGLFMWRDWNEKAVEEDLRLLDAHGIHVLRIFPLWSDFQPLRMHMGSRGMEREVRLGEEPLPFTPDGRAGLDPTMLSRFERFCELAEQYNMLLIVGLLTGWMSGRLFVPEMLQGRNVLADPLALEWEIRFVRRFVERFRGQKAIVAWDLGNECNCMGEIASHSQAYVWAATISLCIRAEDNSRPIVSGMHGLLPDGCFRMQDQAEFLDVLCTHPYPIFTPHCDTDPLNRMKSPLHAAAESLFYAGISGKPCFAEEMGVLGPMVISDEGAADYIRMALFTLLAHDCKGMLWWCAFEQSALSPTPYDWNGVERELGLFYADKQPKPVLTELSRFSDFVHSLPFDRLPPPIADAVCVLTHGQDTWAVAYGAFILAKQAGLTLRFAWADQDLPPAQAYLLPALEGDSSISRSQMSVLLDRVEHGAKLYISMDGPQLSPFSAFSGVRVLSRRRSCAAEMAELDGKTVPLSRKYILEIENLRADILARTVDGEIAFSRCAFGQGEVYILPFPIEKTMSTQPGIVDAVDTYPLYTFYRMLRITSEVRAAQCDHPTIGLTEHVFSEDEHALVMINYEPYAQRIPLRLHDAWRITNGFAEDATAYQKSAEVELPANNGIVFLLEKTDKKDM